MRIKRSGPPKRKARTASERQRIYGPKSYVPFVKSSPCAHCSVEGYSETAHNGNGGMGRKKDWTETMPLCGPRKLTSGNWYEGCHAKFDRHELVGFDAEKAVTATQQSFHEYQGEPE